MKRFFLRTITTLFIMVFVMIALQSCTSVSALIQDDSFREGFRQGWNVTAPPEYHY